MRRTLIIGTCKPGKEFRASEELMDIIMHADPTVVVVEHAKGVVVGTTALTPRELAEVLKGKITAYINKVYAGDEPCEKCGALKKGCLMEVPEGNEAVCVGKALVRVKVVLDAKKGVLSPKAEFITHQTREPDHPRANFHRPSTRKTRGDT